MTEQYHDVIWLAPWCDGCNRHNYGEGGRTWCADNVYEACEECGRQPVKYVAAPDQLTPLDIQRSAPE